MKPELYPAAAGAGLGFWAAGHLWHPAAIVALGGAGLLWAFAAGMWAARP